MNEKKITCFIDDDITMKEATEFIICFNLNKGW